MVQVPAFLAVTTPLALTAATLLLELLHTTSRFARFHGRTDAFSVCVLPRSRETL